MTGTTVLTGLEWYGIRDLLEYLLKVDKDMRKKGKTLFYKRSDVEAAFKELKRAKKSSRSREVYYVVDQLALNFDDSHICVPERVTIKLTQPVVFGIAAATCKGRGLHYLNIGITPWGNKLSEKFWNRMLLHFKRSVGGKKAAYRRKGYIAKYKEVPDFRDEEWHEGAKLFYDLKEIEK
ncbi:hypothetical protein KAW18_01970 [candidate division WOR-3 bacterium]|nr:hypothetical protein [candidate division WOR-3 bacterium]